MRRDSSRSIGDIAQVGLVILIQRGGNANDDGVHFGQTRVVRSCLETLGASLLNLTGQNADDVGTALHQGADFALVDVETGHAKLLLGVKQGERQTYVAQANNGNPRLTLFNLVFQLSNRTGRK